MTGRRVRRVANLLLLGGGLAVCLVLLRVSGASPGDLALQVVQVGPWWFAALVAVTGVIFLGLAARWRILVGAFADVSAIPLRYFFYNTCVGVFMMNILSIPGYMGSKSLSLKADHDVCLFRCSYAVAVELITGFIVLAVMLGPSVLYMTGAVSATVGLALYAAALAVVFVGFRLYYKGVLALLLLPLLAVVRQAARLPLLRGRLNAELFDPAPFYALDNRTAHRLILWTLVANYGVLAKSIMLFSIYGIDVSLPAFFLAYPVGYLVSSVGVTPGNIGVTEAGWFGVLAWLGVSPGEAAVWVFGSRVLNFVTDGIISLLGVAAHVAGKRRAGGAAVRGLESQPAAGEGK